MDKCRLVNLDKDIILPEQDAKDMTAEERDNRRGYGVPQVDGD
jgi:magnesium chelatase subunit H